MSSKRMCIPSTSASVAIITLLYLEAVDAVLKVERGLQQVEFLVLIQHTLGGAVGVEWLCLAA